MKKLLNKIELLPVLENKDFLRIWSAQIISLVIAHMLNFVLIDKIFKATHSTVAVGLFFVLYYVPTVLLGPFAGVFVDRWDKKKILVLSNLFQAGVVLFYLGLGDEIWPIYAIVLLYSLFDEFFNPAVGASLPAVVKKISLPIANGFFLFTTQGALASGFLLGGLMLRFLESYLPIFLFASLALFLAGLVASGLERKILEEAKKTKFGLLEFQKQLVEGYNFIKNEPRVLFPIMLLAFLQVLIGMAVILLPSISHQVLNITFVDSSFILIVPAVLGAAFGAFLVGRLIKSRRKKTLISFGLFVVGFLIVFFDLTIPLVGFPVLLAVLLALSLGVSFTFISVPSQTLVQEHTPFGVRGRVFSALSSLVNLAAFIPMLITASLVDLFGISTVLLGIALLVLGLGFYARQGKYGLLGINHWA